MKVTSKKENNYYRVVVEGSEVGYSVHSNGGQWELRNFDDEVLTVEKTKKQCLEYVANQCYC